MRTQGKIHLNYCNEPGYPLSATIQIFVNSNKFYFPSHRSAAELVPEDRNEQRWLYGFPERGPHRELAAGETCRLFSFPGAPWRESAAGRENMAGCGPVRGERGVLGRFREAGETASPWARIAMVIRHTNMHIVRKTVI